MRAEAADGKAGDVGYTDHGPSRSVGIPGHFAMCPVSGAPSRREPPAKRKLDAAERRDAHLMALALDDERACKPGMLLEPFGPRPAHIVQLRPVAIRQISHLSIPEAPLAGPTRAGAFTREWAQGRCQRVYSCDGRAFLSAQG